MPQVNLDRRFPNRSFRRITARLSLISCATLVAGCAGGDAPVSESDERLRLPVAELVSIGELEGDDPYLFGYFVGTALLPDGRIVTVDDGSNELRFFDADGQFLYAEAGRGEGPGELLSPHGLLRERSGGVRVLDRQSISTYSDSGAFEDRVRIDTESFQLHFPNGMIRSTHYLVPGHRVLATYSPSAEAADDYRVSPPGTTGVIRPIQGYLLGPPDAEAVTRIGELPGLEQLAPGHSAPFSLIPFFRSQFVVAGGEPLRLFLIDSGDPDIRVVDQAGAEVGSIRYPWEGDPIEDSDRAAWLDVFIDENPYFAEQRAEFLSAWAQARLPDRAPIIDRAFVDQLGRLWLKRFPGAGRETSRFDIFQPDGTHDGWFEVEGDVAGADATADLFLGVHRDGQGVTRVKLYAFLD